MKSNSRNGTSRFAVTVDEFGNIVDIHEDPLPEVQSGASHAIPKKRKRRKRRSNLPPEPPVPLPLRTRPAPVAGITDSGALVICQICGSQVKRENITKHLKGVHPNATQMYEKVQKAIGKPLALRLAPAKPVPLPEPPKPSSPAPAPSSVKVTRAKDGNFRCPFCVHRLSQKELLAPHIADKHPDYQRVRLLFPEAKSPKRYRSQSGSKHTDSIPTTDLPSHDPLDGGKHLGHMRRENGKFGSLPLYDDYEE